MEGLLVLVLLGLLVAIATPALYALRRRMAQPGELEFFRLLQRRGMSTESAKTDGRAFAVALRRCALCPSIDTCNEWLEGRRREALEDFCPNARYLERLERK